MSTFDPEAFLSQSFSEANATKSEPIPVGVYTAIISSEPDAITTRTWQGKKDPSKSGVALDIDLLIDSPAVAESIGRQNPMKVTYGIMLDTIPDGTGGSKLDMGRGKNIRLGKLRDAAGLNIPGQPFSFRMLSGRMIKVSLKHRIDGDNIYNEVDAVAPV